MQVVMAEFEFDVALLQHDQFQAGRERGAHHVIAAVPHVRTPQHQAGPHRQYLEIPFQRRLGPRAVAGFDVVRSPQVRPRRP
ncbi:hypothetical protein G6F57_022428 [Rhizopus arrhizus]|nr:hypothetical protein G6F57_022428 [Rhizopus arrhizus]